MYLILGTAFIAFGIVEFVIAGSLARNQASSTGGLGAESPPAARMLRVSGMLTAVIGVVLIIVELAS